MYSILADLIAALAGAAFIGATIWLGTARLADDPVPAEAVILSITAAIIGIIAGTSAVTLRAAHRRERR